MNKGHAGVRADEPQSYRNLELIARQVRGYLKLAEDEALDGLSLFENLDEVSIKLRSGKIIPFRSGVVSLEDSEGYTRYDHKKNVMEILASEQTYDWLETGLPRAAYFIAHELGHCILHTYQLVRLAEMPTRQQAAFHRGQKGHESYEDNEWQANAFASALLMHARGLQALDQARGCLTVSLVVERFGVSSEAAGYRLDLYQKRRNELLN